MKILKKVINIKNYETPLYISISEVWEGLFWVVVFLWFFFFFCAFWGLFFLLFVVVFLFFVVVLGLLFGLFFAAFCGRCWWFLHRRAVTSLRCSAPPLATCGLRSVRATPFRRFLSSLRDKFLLFFIDFQ